MSDRVDYDESGKLDEVVATGGAHLEYMGSSQWFLSLTHADGSETAIWFKSKNLRNPFMETREPRPQVQERREG